MFEPDRVTSDRNFKDNPAAWMASSFAEISEWENDAQCREDERATTSN